MYAVYRYTAGIHRVFSTAQNTAFGLATTAETMVGNAGCDAEWVPMTPHTSQIVRDTKEQLCQAQAHTYIAVWPPVCHLPLGIQQRRSTAAHTAFSCCIPVYSALASSRAACRGIQLYSGIQRSTVYSSTAVYSIQRSTFPLRTASLMRASGGCPGLGGARPHAPAAAGFMLPLGPEP